MYPSRHLKGLQMFGILATEPMKAVTTDQNFLNRAHSNIRWKNVPSATPHRVHKGVDNLFNPYNKYDINMIYTVVWSGSPCPFRR